jgi:formate hydrogenlyase subunit 6/NADH:ubiquinone oxidoreductase subunit I
VQDGVSNLSARRRGKRARFRHWTPPAWLRYGLLVAFVACMVAGVSAVVSLLDPWGAFGRIAQNILGPLWRLGNNGLAWMAERADSYAFHSADVYVKSAVALGVAVVWLVGVAALAWWKGRVYCNTICPVGTFLGLFSRVAPFRVRIDHSRCTKCGVCEKTCKGECIDSKAGTIALSRCVSCFDCIEKCREGAIKYSPCKPKASVVRPATGADDPVEVKKGRGVSRRGFFSIAALAAAASPAALRAQQVERVLLQVDGGLADIADKKRPPRKTPITPPGSEDARNMKRHCTACQLCVAACPEHVLVPSSRLETLLQPEMTFERGYCRPECVECSAVCPTGAIKKITAADKTAVSVGKAAYFKDLCVVTKDDLACTVCQRHCPTTAITLVPVDPNDRRSLKIPVVNDALCIGCGACENLCPARPLAAMRVEGNVSHHILQ